MTEPTADDQELAATAARLMNDYFFGLDNRDFASATACFTDAVECSYGGIALPPGREAVVEYLNGALGGVRSTRHFLTSSAQVRTPAGARVRTHAIAYVLTGAGTTGEAQVRGIAYDDELVMTDRGWLVARRNHSVEWASTSPAVFVAPGEDALARSGATTAEGAR